MINLNAPFLMADGKTVSREWAAFLNGLAQQSNVVVSFNGRGGTVRLAGSDVTSALGFTPARSNNAYLTGVPTADTAPVGTNTKQIATTAFVLANPAITIGAWQAPLLLNGWVNVGTPYSPAGYCSDTLGIVRLRGVVKTGTVGASTPIFKLPTGFIPPYQLVFTVVSNAALGILSVDASGNVAAVSGNNASVSLDGISFRNA